MEKKWYYSFDGKSIFKERIREVTKFSYDNLKEFYEVALKNLTPKSVAKSAEVLKCRKTVEIEINKW